ncbi:MAG: hypothetical protein WBD27_16795 [Pyrinomonadaceae bacterium]
MNEDELKQLWKADGSSPTIDFAGLQKLSDDWHDKLRRKARIDAWLQGITTVVSLVPVFFYPRLIFAAILVLILGVWYVRKLRGLYNDGRFEIGSIAVRQSIKAKIKDLNSFFWRTRTAVYVFTPLTLIAVYYGIGAFDRSSVTFINWVISLSKILIIAEVAVVTCTEIYFKLIYKPAMNELKTLLLQLDTLE